MVKVSARTTRPMARILKELGDGEWHRSEDILRVAVPLVPPGIAFRRADKLRRRSLGLGPDVPMPPRQKNADLSTQTRVGARSIVNDLLHGFERRNKIEKRTDVLSDGSKVRMFRIAPEYLAQARQDSENVDEESDDDETGDTIEDAPPERETIILSNRIERPGFKKPVDLIVKDRGSSFTWEIWSPARKSRPILFGSASSAEQAEDRALVSLAEWNRRQYVKKGTESAGSPEPAEEAVETVPVAEAEALAAERVRLAQVAAQADVEAALEEASAMEEEVLRLRQEVAGLRAGLIDAQAKYTTARTELVHFRDQEAEIERLRSEAQRWKQEYTRMGERHRSASKTWERDRVQYTGTISDLLAQFLEDIVLVEAQQQCILSPVILMDLADRASSPFNRRLNFRINDRRTNQSVSVTGISGLLRYWAKEIDETLTGVGFTRVFPHPADLKKVDYVLPAPPK